MNLSSVTEAADILRHGGVVAYPTESCFGLGCDPANAHAVRRILRIKHREWEKGLILISDHFTRLKRYVERIPEEFYNDILHSWPGPNTWLLPARSGAPRWLRGTHPTIAVRVTAHPVSRSLCARAGFALVSTSANRAGRPSARTPESVQRELGDDIDCIVRGRIGNRKTPSTIRDGTSGMLVR